jgi:thioesterase domain-containing protein
MSVLAFLSQLRARDIQVWADGDRLRCNAPAGALTPDLHDELQRRKPEILQFLGSAGTLAQQQRAIVPLQPRGQRTPVFGVAGHNGDVFCYRNLARQLGEDQPLYGLQPPGLDGQSAPLRTVAELAAYFCAQIRAFHQGPCIIAGFCAGGSIAFELARQLLQAGMAIEFLALFGAPYPARYRRLTLLRERIEQELEHKLAHMRALAALPPTDWRGYIARELAEREARRATEAPTDSDEVLARRARVERATLAAAGRYVPGHYPGRVCLLIPHEDWARTLNDPLRWRSVAPHTQEYFGPKGCNGDNMLRETYAPVFAELFRNAARRAA